MTQRKRNLGLDEIVSIEDMGMIDTYDFTIPDTNCFFANDILVHNSGALEENCDTCLLLHWDYIYTSNANKFNDYSVFVAKQRNGMTGRVGILFLPQYYKFEERPL